ncbi:uncharacterized protein LOC128195629 [Vigna angularis]|uniref:uncharacterized protein LOC128195629 n=1 Tax=Phaseolus angularis TaxID=3914 RepID=UPI0022B509C2|nr:uncharacterized protein LOC128195629 [Vigna angularis]
MVPATLPTTVAPSSSSVGPPPTPAIHPPPTSAIHPPPTPAVDPTPTSAIHPPPTPAIDPTPTSAIHHSPTPATDPLPPPVIITPTPSPMLIIPTPPPSFAIIVPKPRGTELLKRVAPCILAQALGRAIHVDEVFAQTHVRKASRGGTLKHQPSSSTTTADEAVVCLTQALEQHDQEITDLRAEFKNFKALMIG